MVAHEVNAPPLRRARREPRRQPSRLLAVALGIMTATGGFLDAGTIVTASQAGARFGLGLVWALVLGTIAIILLVEMVGRFAAVSGKTYAEAIREHFGFKFYLLPLTSELIAETVMLAAEVCGVAVAIRLVTGLPLPPLIVAAALLVWVITWRAPFSVIENGPALLGLVTLSFFAAVLVLGGPSPDLLGTIALPHMGGDLGPYLGLGAAILGATISPNMLFFYSAGAREEEWGPTALTLNRITAVLGMGFGGAASLALMLLAALVLGPMRSGGESIQDVSRVLTVPFGSIGLALFATAVFATCLGAALEVSLGLSYNIAQGLGWEWGENKTPMEAPRFNLTLTILLVVATVIGVIAGSPIGLAVVASGLIALFLPFSLFPFLVIMNSREYLGRFTNSRLGNAAIIGILVLASVVALVSLPLMVVGA